MASPPSRPNSSLLTPYITTPTSFFSILHSPFSHSFLLLSPSPPSWLLLKSFNSTNKLQPLLTMNRFLSNPESLLLEAATGAVWPPSSLPPTLSASPLSMVLFITSSSVILFAWKLGWIGLVSENSVDFGYWQRFLMETQCLK